MSTIVVPTHPHLPLGRTPRTYKPMLHFNALKGALGAVLDANITFDYTTGLPSNMGVLWNDTYGCCTAAAKYHRLQAVVFKLTGKFIPADELAGLVLRFYEATTGFNPTIPGTDQGGNMQDIADYLVKTGLIRPDGTVDRFTAAFEIDPTNSGDLAFCGHACIGVDFGIEVTTSIMPRDGSAPPVVWDVAPDDETLGGHDVYGFARLPNGNWKVNSWGNWYEMTPAFMQKYMEEAYAYVSSDALKDGKTVLGWTEAQWQAAVAGHATAV